MITLRVVISYSEAYVCFMYDVYVVWFLDMFLTLINEHQTKAESSEFISINNLY